MLLYTNVLVFLALFFISLGDHSAASAKDVETETYDFVIVGGTASSCYCFLGISNCSIQAGHPGLL